MASLLTNVWGYASFVGHLHDPDFGRWFQRVGDAVGGLPGRRPKRLVGVQNALIDLVDFWTHSVTASSAIVIDFPIAVPHDNGPILIDCGSLHGVLGRSSHRQVES